MRETAALGLGNNVDYEIKWDARIIESLVNNYAIKSRDLESVGPIRSERDLVISTLGYMQRGTGTERYVEDLKAIIDLSDRFEVVTTIGGTAPRAAIAMSRIGVPASVHLVTMNDQVRKLMPRDGSWYCSSATDSAYPHLIVQYEKGACVKAADIDITAPTSTRLIYVNDPDNETMRLEPRFFENARHARVFLVSGFNAMHDGALLRARLSELVRFLDALPDHVTVFYEDACFHDAALQRVVVDALASRIDVFSLNEDEVTGYVGERVDPRDAGSMQAALGKLHGLIPVPTLVVHTRCWALASGGDSGRFGAALRRGIAMAATRFRLGDRFTREDFERTHGLPDNGEGRRFAQEIARGGEDGVCCLPCKTIEEKNVTTVGLGDAFVGGFLSAMSGAGN